MKDHRETLLSLYDYCEGTLPEDDRRAVEEHLRECDECGAELATLMEAREALARTDRSPADRLPDSYWVGFADRIAAALPVRRRRRPAWIPAIAEVLFVRRWKPVLAVGGALATFLVAYLSLREPAASPAPEAAEPPGMAELPVDTVGLRMERYLKRSKALLVGLRNSRDAGALPVGPAVERRVSRQLAEESRLLRRESLDPRGYRLVDDLEKIFIGLANTRDEQWTPAVEIVRSGVEEENLLFKIRMAESAYGHARVIPASYRR